MTLFAHPLILANLDDAIYEVCCFVQEGETPKTRMSHQPFLAFGTSAFWSGGLRINRTFWTKEGLQRLIHFFFVFNDVMHELFMFQMAIS